MGPYVASWHHPHINNHKHNSNHRPTWNASVDEPVAGNYYPINAAAFLHDAHAQFSVVVDRSQVGGLHNSMPLLPNPKSAYTCMYIHTEIQAPCMYTQNPTRPH